MTVPALYVAGDRDLVVSFPGMDQLIPNLAQFVPNLRKTIMLPGCGHWTQQERPKEVNDAMVAFLTDPVGPQETSMGHTLEQLAAKMHDILAAEPGPGGREKVRALVEEVLKDEAFVAQHLGDDVPERKILFEDPQLGFCILAHVYKGARESNPHDHGPTWAIYGQARGETLMNDWALVEPASDAKPGKVRHVRSYPLKPGMAHVYNEGDLHSPRRDGPTRLIRIEGRNMDKVKRLAYDKV